MRFRISLLVLSALLIGTVAAQAQTWVTRASMPTARSQPAVVTDANGLIHVLGGNSSGGSTTHQVYNPDTNSWSTAAVLPAAMYGADAALGPDGDLYLFGGYGGDELNTLYVYDVAGNSWSAAASNPTGLGWQIAGAFGPDGRLYAFGGENNETQVARYDPAGNTWTLRTPMPAQKRYHGVALGDDGLFYVFGGADVNGNAQSSTYIYDPVADSWSAGPSMPTSVLSFGYGAFGGRIWVAGGSTDNGNNSPPYFNSVYVFDQASGTWSTFPQNMPTARRELGGAVSGNAFYAIGGSAGAQLDTNEALIDLPGGPAPAVPAVSEIGMLLLAAALGAFALFALKR